MRRSLPAIDYRSQDFAEIIRQREPGWLDVMLAVQHGVFEMLQGSRAPDGLLINAIGPPCRPGWRRGDAPTQEISANDLMWAFFEAHLQP